MQLIVIIPVLNEEKTIKKVLDQVLAEKVSRVVVVDDGSTDKSFQLLSKLKIQNSKLKIIQHKRNMGKGAAIRTALQEIDDGYFIIQDGDLEYDPSQFGLLMSHAGGNIAVYGSRLLVDINKHAYTRTYLGNVLLTSVFNILYGRHLTDTYTCYKLMPVEMAKSLDLKSSGFEIEAEITAKLAKKGIEILEVPIKFSPRKYEEGKKIKAVDALKGLWTFLKVRLTW